MVAWTIQLSDGIFWSERCHANNTFIFLAESTEKFFGKPDPWDWLHDLWCLWPPRPTTIDTSKLDIDEQSYKDGIENKVNVA